MNKELKLHKEIIAQLGNPEMNRAQGGETSYFGCFSICNTLCNQSNTICEPPGPETVNPCTIDPQTIQNFCE